jgi:2-polyprenyl-6-methoxyphenol hydroxylase-like FAD-dependent oxidoreductase
MRVLISGAGIAGPTLAWFLSKTGARVTIVEKNKSLLSHGQNVDIQGSAVTVIKKMGLMDQIRQFNTTEKGTQFIDSKGRPFAPFPVKQDSSMSFTSEFEILRGDLAKVLYEASKDFPNVKYLFGTTIKAVVSNDNDVVKVELSNGEMQEFDLLVAADGQWSKLRKQCFPSESVSIVDQGMYAVYWTTPRLASDNDWWNIYQASGSRIITLRPDPHGTIRAMFTHMPCNEAQKEAWQMASKSDRQTQEKLLRKEFEDAGWQAQRLLDTMDQTPDFYFQAIQQIKVTKWSSSRVICLGDAAYAPTPLTGMGTSLAILGAYVLAGELSKLEIGEDFCTALDAYESKFRPFVEEAQEIPFFVPSIAHPESLWKRWLFQFAISALSKVVGTVRETPWLARRLDISNEMKDDGFQCPQYPRLDDPESNVVKHD